MQANLQNPIFHDEDLARAALEAVRYADRVKAIAEGIEGKRLTYRRPD